MALAFALAFAGTARADKTRSSTTDNLNLGTAWVGGTAPGNGDIALWDANSTLANTLGAGLTWGGLDISSASGSVTISGANTLTLANSTAASTKLVVGANNFTYNSSGTFNIGSAAGGTFSGSSTVTIGGAATKNWKYLKNITFNGTLQLRGGSATSGTFSGNWLLLCDSSNGNSPGATQTGSFALDTGASLTDRGEVIVTESFGGGAALNLSSLTGYGDFRSDWTGPTSSSGPRVISVNQSGNTTFNGRIVENNTGVRQLALTKSGAGTLTLSGLNNYSGGTTVNAGKLRLTTSSGGTGTIRGTLTINSGATVEVGGADVLGYSTGSDAVRTLNINGGTITQTMNRNETFSGVMNLTTGTVSASGGANALFDLFGGSAAVNSKAAANASTISSPLRLRQNNSTFTVEDGAAAEDLVVSGVISHSAGEGNGAIIKAGAGTMKVTGANTYDGGTTVNAGTLLVANSAGSGTGSGSVTVNSGATLSGTGTISGATTINSGATLTVGGSTGTTMGTLTFGGNLTLAGNTTLRLNKGGATISDKIAKSGGTLTFGGTLTLASVGDPLVIGDQFTIFSTGGTGSFSSISPANPNNDPNLLWDVSSLGTGVIKVMSASTVVTPTFSPAGGGYVGAQSVTISTTTEGATIYYTTDGSTPTTSSAVYSSPLPVDVPMGNYTIQAFAVKSGSQDSSVSTAVYNTVTTPTWTADENGSWADSAKWQNTVIGSGTDVMADFSTVNLTADRTVTLDGARTIGGLKFGDATTADFNWIVNSGTGGPLTLDVTSGSPVVQVANQTTTVGAVLAGAKGLTKTGNGTLMVSGVNTYSGGTVLAGGTLKLGHAQGIGKSGSFGGQLTIKDGAFDLNGQQNYANVNQSGSPQIWLTTATVTLGGAAGGTPRIIDTGATPLGIAFAASTALVYDATSNPGMATIAAKWGQSGTSNPGTRTVDVGDSLNTDVEVDFTGGLGDPSAWDGRSTTIKKIGAGTMRISSPNAFPGLQVTAGKLLVNHVQALGLSRTNSGGAANLVAVEGGTLDLNGFSPNIGGLSDGGLATGVVRNDGEAPGTLTIGSSGASTTYSGTIQDGLGGVSLVKTGGGTLSLNGGNSYTGSTTVSAGTLAGTGTVAGPVVVEIGATLLPGGAAIGTLTINNALTLNPGSSMQIKLNRANSQTSDKVAGLTSLMAAGALTVTNIGEPIQGGDSFTLFSVAPTGAFAATNLPALGAGLNWWTPDNYATLVANRAPVDSLSHNLTRAKGASVKIKKTDLMAGVRDPDSGDSASYEALVNTGGQGATVTEDATYVYYVPANDNNDTVQFRVKDTRGGFLINNIAITVQSATGLPGGQVAVSGTSATLSFFGIPGYAYKVQRSLDLSVWADLPNSTTNAPAAGGWQYVDEFSDLGYVVPSAAYYRLAQP